MLLASVAASLLSLKLVPRDSRMAISIFFLVRALEILGKKAANNGFIPHVPHAEGLIMALASAQVIWSWLFFRETLEGSYLRFLDHQGGRNKWVQYGYAGLAQWGPHKFFKETTIVEGINKWRKQGGFQTFNQHDFIHRFSSPAGTTTPPSLFPSPFITLTPCELACQILHPDTPYCSLAFIKFFICISTRSPCVWSRVLIASRDLPSASLAPDTYSIDDRDTQGNPSFLLFLSLYCSLAWYTACIVTVYCRYHGSASGAISGFVAGWTVELEKKGRRIELALYVLAQAIPAFAKTLRHYKLIPNIPHVEFPIPLSPWLQSWIVTC